MRLDCRTRDALFAGLIAVLAFPGVAYAYVDPGSGSIIVTAVLGAIAAVGYTLRKYLYRMRNALRREPDDQQK